MPDFPTSRALGTELRALLDRMDADIGDTLADLGLQDYRGRFSPVIRALVDSGPASVREIAKSVGVTHSAASQTVAAMVKNGWAVQRTGTDARERIVELTERAQDALPAIRAEWEATASAQIVLDAELPCPLERFVTDLRAALDRTPFRERIAAAAREHTGSADVARHREALAGA